MRTAARVPAFPEHLSLATWLALLYGQSTSLLWFWGRDGQGQLPGLSSQSHVEMGWYADALPFHPGALEEYVQTTFQANLVSDLVADIVARPARIHLLMALPTQTLDAWAAQVLAATFEALSFSSEKVGLVEERQLWQSTHLDHGLVRGNSRAWLVIPQTTFVHDETVKAISELATRGGRIIVVCNRSEAVRVAAGLRDPCEDVLRLRPDGSRRHASQLAFLRALPHVHNLTAHIPHLTAALGAILSTNDEPSVHCLEANDLDALPVMHRAAHGVLCRTAMRGQGSTVFIFNLLRFSATVHLSIRGARIHYATDVLSGQKVSLSKGLRLPVRRMRVLRCHIQS